MVHMKYKSKRIDLYLPEEWINEMDRMAREMGLTRSDLIRMAIKEFLHHKPTEVAK